MYIIFFIMERKKKVLKPEMFDESLPLHGVWKKKKKNSHFIQTTETRFSKNPIFIGQKVSIWGQGIGIYIRQGEGHQCHLLYVTIFKQQNITKKTTSHYTTWNLRVSNLKKKKWKKINWFTYSLCVCLCMCIICKIQAEKDISCIS